MVNKSRVAFFKNYKSYTLKSSKKSHIFPTLGWIPQPPRQSQISSLMPKTLTTKVGDQIAYLYENLSWKTVKFLR